MTHRGHDDIAAWECFRSCTLRKEGSRADWVATETPASFSRSCPLRKVQAATIADDSLALVRQWAAVTKGWAITSLGLSTSGFTSAPTGNSTLQR